MFNFPTVTFFSGSAFAKTILLFSDSPLVGRTETLLTMKEAVHAREGAPRRASPRRRPLAVKEKEEEKGRILVNALPALTSATSRCIRPTRDQIPSKLRERADASRRVQLHRAVLYDGGALPMQLESLSAARVHSNIAAIYVWAILGSLYCECFLVVR